MKFLYNFILISLLVSIAYAGKQEERQKLFNLKDGVAIQGYDPVSYFIQGKPTKGKNQFAANYNGVIYKFSSSENLALFKKQPAKYEPQQGGWCAYALVFGEDKVKINPKRFKVIDGKLYLFYDTFYGPNTLKLWNNGEDSKQIKAADKNWKAIISAKQ